MIISLATISVMYRFCPVEASSHERVWMRPSMYTLLPFFRYCWQISASLRQATMLCHSVFSSR